MKVLLRVLKLLCRPVLIVILLISALYWQFFIQGKIPTPADTLVGAYYPWLGYKWGFPAGVPVKNPPISDVFSQFILWKYLSIDLIKGGIWPLWNPYSYSGYPLLATYASSPLNPFNLLLLLPKYFGWGLFIYGQTLLAALGMYFLASLYTKSAQAKIGAAIIFSMSGLMSTWVEFGTGVWAAAMLPWIFYSLECFLQKKKNRYLFLFTVSFATLFLAGHAQLTVYSSGLLFIYLTYQLLQKKTAFIKGAITLAFFWLLAVLLSLIQLLPALDLSNISIRSAEAYSRSFNFGLSPLYELFKLFASDIFGNPTTYNYWDSVSYHEQMSFLGTLTLPLLLPFLFKRFRDRWINFWGAIFLGSLFLSIDSPITHFLYSQPIPLLTYSSAGRILFITSFSGAILAASSIENLEKNAQFQSLVKRFGVALLAAVAGIILGFVISLWLLKPYHQFGFILEAVKNFNISLKNLVFPAALLTTFLIVLLGQEILQKKSAKFSFSKLTVTILIVLLFIDLGKYFQKYNPFVPALFVFPQTPITRFLQNKEGLFRIGRADHSVLTPNTWTAYKLQSVEGYDPLALHDYTSLFNRINNKPYNTPVSRYSEITEYPSKFLDALNVKYLLAVSHDQFGIVPGPLLNYKISETRYKKVFEDKGTVILENPDALERAFFVSKITTFPDKESLIKRLDNPTFDPTKEALVVSKKPIEGSTGGSIKFLKYSPNEIVLSVQTNLKSFIVVSESYTKGWKAFINEREVSISEVDGGIRGIQVPEGSTKIKMIYSPDSFEIGKKISFASLMILIFLAGVSFKRKAW